MENGVGKADGTPLEEVKGEESEVLESKVEEKAAAELHGRKESKGDEVFGEAVEAVIPVVNSEDGVDSDDKTWGQIGDLGGSMEVNQMTFDNDDEVERFEEAIGVSGTVLRSSGRLQKEGVLVGEVPFFEFANQTRTEILNGDEVMVSNVPPVWVENQTPSVPNSDTESEEDAEVRVREVLPVEEANQSPDVSNSERKSGEEAGVLAREMHPAEEENQAPSEIPIGGRESEEKAELLVTEEFPIVEQAVSREVLVNGGEELKDVVLDSGEHELRHAANDYGAVGTADIKIADEDGIGAVEQETEVHGQPETPDASEVKVGDTDAGMGVESNGINVHQDVMNIEVSEIYGTPDTGHQDNKSINFENAEARQVLEHKGNGIQKGDAMNSNDEQLKEMKTLSVQPESHGNQGKEKDGPAVSTVAPSNHLEYATLVDNICTSVEEETKKSEAAKSPITLYNSSVEGRTKAAEVEESAPSGHALAKEDIKVSLGSSKSAVRSSWRSHPQPANENGGVSKVEVNQAEKESGKDEETRKSIPGNRRQEVKPVTDNSSSSSQSSCAPGSASVPARPAGLGRAAPLLEPAPRVVQQPRVNGSASSTQNQLVEESTNGEAEEYDETREKLQMIRVKFLRLAHRLGQTPHNVVVAQVLYRLGLAEQLRGRNGGRVAAFSFDRASAMAEQLEAAGQEPLDFSCTIMVLGKTGVGKSATINSIFDEVKFGTDAFHLGTKKVQDVVGTVQGIKVRVIDTPGLLPSWSDQRQNERILHPVKRFIKKTPPDIVLYLDRLDMQSRDFGDMPLLRTITEIFGPSIWFNAIVVLTHAASAPPEGPNGTATSYDMFVTQRSHAVQQAIRQAAGDMRLMNPVSLVENHSACRTNRAGQRVLPNGQVWKPHLLLLSFASKILAEANTLLKLQDSPPGRPFVTRTRAPPLPFLLSSLLQSRPQIKLPTDQFGGDDDSLDDDLDDSSDSEDESEYDQLPLFRSLTKAQLAKLPRYQRKAYYAELEYREKLFIKKQLKEDKKRRKMMKETQAMAKDLPADYNEGAEEESSGAASVPVPMPDLALPASFDSDNPTHRYRCLDSSNQWLVRPVLEPNGWDHDVGYEGINVERLFAMKEKIPVSFSGQVSKDKKDTNLQMEVATSVKHGEGKATSLGFDMQSVGKDIAYTLRGETRFINYRRNKATTGLSVTILGDTITGGVKVEDRLIVNKRGQLVVSGGAMFGRGDVAYGGSLEATLRDKDHPLGRFLSTLGLSVMDWHGDLAIGCNSQTQIPIGRFTNLIGRVNINNKGSGQVSIRLNSSEQLQIALISLIPFARKLLGYSQQAQFGQ